MVQLCHVGARFEALGALIFIAPSVSSCIFFYLPRFPSGTMWVASMGRDVQCQLRTTFKLKWPFLDTNFIDTRLALNSSIIDHS